MNIFQIILLIFIGLVSGIMTAAGLFAFITLIGVVERMAARTKTNKYVVIYEDMVLLGTVLGNLMHLYKIQVPLGNPFMIVYGIFSGIFVGTLSVALAEVVNVIPVFARRVNLKYGIPVLVVCFALGKAVGAAYHLLF